jgi:hypothetical protein
MVSILTDPTWHPLRRPELGPINLISDQIEGLERRNPGLLTTLRLGPTLALFCDYSGHHRASTHEAFSFLLVDLVYCWRWEEARRVIRKKFLNDSRRMSFKALNDRQRRQALMPFLQAADSIPGIVFTVVVDKHIKHSAFDFCAGEMQDPAQRFDHWNQSAFQRFVLMAHLGSLLLSGLSAPGQNVLWFTDEDDLAANDLRVTEGTRGLANITSNYLRHNLGHLRFGTTKCDPGNRSIEDLAAIADLAAGALNEIVTSCQLSPIFIPTPHSLSPKTRAIAGWLSDHSCTLKRLTFVVERGNEGKIKVHDLVMRPDPPTITF